MENTTLHTPIDKKSYLTEVQAKVDKIIDRFVIAFFILGFCFAPIYNTWVFSSAIGSFTVLIYLLARFVITNKFISRMIISVVLAMFVLQYIGQVHGMAELHFFFFTNIALLILYQDWRLVMPYTIITVTHHTLLAFFQIYLGNPELGMYFISYTNITFLQMAFHFGIISLMAYIAIFWSVMLRKNSTKLFEMQELTARQNQQLLFSETKLQEALANTENEVKRQTIDLQKQTEELQAGEEELRQNLEELSATQEQLQHSHIDLEGKMLAINSTVGYMELGLDKKIITINNKLANWLEYDTQELEGQLHIAVVEPNYAQSSEYENFWQDLGKGRVFSEEFLRITKTGKQIWVNASYCPIKDENGKVTKIIKLAVNITEQKEKAQELLASEEELRQNLEELQATQDKLQEAAIEQEKFVGLVKNSNAFIAMADMQGNILFLNEAAKQMSGFGENYKGTNISDYHDEAQNEISKKQIVPTVMSKGLWRGEEQIININTKQVYITDATVFVIKNPETGQPICLATVQNDVTEQKQAALLVVEKEQKISRIINALPNCVFEAVLDTKTNQFQLQFINEAVIDVFGVTPEAALLDINALIGAMCEGEYVRFGEAMGEGLKTMSAFAVVYSINKPDRSIAFLNSYNKPTLLADGNIRMTTVVTDITATRKAEQEIQAQNEELQANEEELKQNLEELSATQENLLVAYENSRLLETLMDNSSDAFQAAEDNGKLIYMNKTGLSRLGFTKEQMLGMYVRDYEKLFAEDGTWEAHVADMKALKSLTIQSVNHDKTNNRDFPVEVSIRHVEIGDKGYLMATSRDITERRKAEVEIQAQNEALRTQEEEIRQNMEELVATQEQLQVQFGELSVKNKNISDSINYAKRIQTALLPRLAEIQSIFPESFVLFRPKDVISGDFYWFANKTDYNLQILVAADCTGHGVPGAFMSMLGSSLLSNIIHDREVHEPNKILDLLHISVEEMLNQRQEDNTNRDGMDATICVIDRNENRIHYAGANNSLYVISQNPLNFVVGGDETNKQIVVLETENWLLTELKADKKPVGGRVIKQDDLSYNFQTFEMNQELRIYLSSDGFIDQIGGESRKKMMSKNFKQLLMDNHKKPYSEQQGIFNDLFENWISYFDNKQLDDVMLLGVKVNQ